MNYICDENELEKFKESIKKFIDGDFEVRAMNPIDGLRVIDKIKELEKLKGVNTKNCKLNLSSWKFNVYGDLDLTYMNFSEIPLEFGHVTGNFICYRNKLTSLKNCPDTIDGDFNCSFNKLSSLEYGPKNVGGEYNCGYNELTSLFGVPEIIKGKFNCVGNQLTSLKDLPKEILGDLACGNNPLKDLKNINCHIHGDFICHNCKNTISVIELKNLIVDGEISIK